MATHRHYAPQDADLAVAAQATLGADRAKAEDEALRDAKRNAIERALGVFLKAKSTGRNFNLDDETITTKASGFLRSWELVPGSEHVVQVGSGRMLRLQIKAEVAALPLLKKLSDLRDTYDDLDRPRLSVQIAGDTPNGAVRSRLIAELRAKGFEVSDGSAEILLEGVLTTRSVIRLGNASEPHGIGEVVGSCNANLKLRILSAASESVLMVFEAEATAASFDSNEAAKIAGAEESARTLIAARSAEIEQDLLLHWSEERQEGHAVALKFNRVSPHFVESLKKEVSDWRGFVRFLGESTKGPNTTIRFVTSLSNKDIRARLRGLTLENFALRVPEMRGPQIAFTAVRFEGGRKSVSAR